MSAARVERTVLNRQSLALGFVEEGEGTPVVLLHALMASADANWGQSGVIHRLVASGRLRVVAPDFRGHGRSARAAEPDAYSLDLVVEDTVGLIQDLDLGPCHLVGYSLGALVAARIAAAGSLPVLRVVLSGIGTKTVTKLPRNEEMEAIVEAMLAEDAQSVTDPGLKAIRLQIQEWRTDPKAVAWMTRALQDKSGVDLSRIQVPVLVVNGIGDSPPAEIADKIAGARSATVEGDHLTAPYDPAIGERIVRFLLEHDELASSDHPVRS